MEAVSFRKASTLLGVSRQTLMMARNVGSLPVEADGKVDMDKVKDSEWFRNRAAVGEPIASASEPTPPEDPGTPRPVRKGDFAVIIGVSAPRVSQMVSAGMPVRKDGWIDIAAAKEWVAANVGPGGRRGPATAGSQSRATMAEQAKAGAKSGPNKLPDGDDDDADDIPVGKLKKLAKIEIEKLLLVERREKIRIDNEARRKELVELGPINIWVAGMIIRAREILVRIGPELRDRLAYETDANKCDEMVTGEIYRALRELGQYQPKSIGKLEDAA